MAYTTIKKPSDYFNTKLYTGNGSTQSITGVGFQPDWVWMKNRSVSGSHQLLDIVRGASKTIYSNRGDVAEETLGDGLTSFDSDGFTISSSPEINGSGNNIVSWNWKASNTTASNTDGSITSTVSANTTSGFSIVSYTGSGTDSDTVGHGLGVAPKMVIVKDRSSGTNQWRVRHESLSSNYNLFLNGTDVAYNMATATNDGGIGDLDNANTFDFVSGLTNAGAVNTSGNTYIAYCFAEKQGFSKFGSYVGNGSTDGSFCYLGMKPKFIMIKRTDSTGDWVIYDGVKEPYNVIDTYLEANSSNADTTLSVRELDILSNGFKVRGTNTSINASGGTYIYMAFAEEPLVGDNPATAR